MNRIIQNGSTVNHIILRETAVEGRRVTYRFECKGEVSEFFPKPVLWIEYDIDITSVPESVLTIPFVSIMLPLMWVSDAALYVNSLDRTFYYQTFHLRRAFQEINPDFALRGWLIPSYLEDNVVEKRRDAFLLFSGGLDATTSYLRNSSRIRVLVNIQGWYHEPEEQSEVAEADFSKVRKFAESEGREFRAVRSNFATLVETRAYHPYAHKMGDGLWHGFQHPMAFISFTMPLVWLNGGGQIIIASSNSVGVMSLCGSKPTTDNEFRFAVNGTTLHDGFHLSRQDKLRIAVDHQRQLGKPYPLQVCSFNDHNCCRCEKCFRTVIGLVAENADPRNFGLDLPEPPLEFYSKLLTGDQWAFFGVGFEKQVYWPQIAQRMRENYNNLSPENRAFVDWFLSFDFVGERHKAVRRYRLRHFGRLLREHLRTKFSK